ncbi:hypothetical protein ACFCXF_40110 [Streptomyces virginiae]|uniref:hypothetical protein n=1 Tax=Streptomyces virginiae TaxID=1961 RepID=UPI0030DF4DA8
MELPGIIAGVAVRAFALPGDCADCGISPVWFTGSTLAYDLSLPRVRERFNPHAAPADWALAEHRIREASALLGRAGQASGAGDAAALGDLLAVAAAQSPALVRVRVRAAASTAVPSAENWTDLVVISWARVTSGTMAASSGTERTRSTSACVHVPSL